MANTIIPITPMMIIIWKHKGKKKKKKQKEWRFKSDERFQFFLIEGYSLPSNFVTRTSSSVFLLVVQIATLLAEARLKRQIIREIFYF